MTRNTLWQCVPIVLVLFLAGCGGCQGGEESKKPAAAPTRPAAAQAPAARPKQPEVDCFVLVDAEPDFGPPPLKAKFSTDTDCTGSPITYSWDFGDGTTGGNEPNPTHTYQKPGDYVATVRVKAPDGGEGEDEIDISVEGNGGE